MIAPIVVGTDGSEESLAAVEWATTEAARRRVPLRVVHVVDRCRGPAADHAQLLGHDLTARLRRDPPHRARSALARASRRANLAAPGVDMRAAAVGAGEARHGVAQPVVGARGQQPSDAPPVRAAHTDHAGGSGPSRAARANSSHARHLIIGWAGGPADS